MSQVVGDQTVLEEVYDSSYEPNEEDVRQYADMIGIDPDREPELMHIAREGIKAPLPKEWKPCQTPKGEIYYFNFNSGESIWEHPCDRYYQTLVAEERKKVAHSSSAKKTKKSNPMSKSGPLQSPMSALGTDHRPKTAVSSTLKPIGASDGLGHLKLGKLSPLDPISGSLDSPKKSLGPLKSPKSLLGSGDFSATGRSKNLNVTFGSHVADNVLVLSSTSEGEPSSANNQDDDVRINTMEFTTEGYSYQDSEEEPELKARKSRDDEESDESDGYDQDIVLGNDDLLKSLDPSDINRLSPMHSTEDGMGTSTLGRTRDDDLGLTRSSLGRSGPLLEIKSVRKSLEKIGGDSVEQRRALTAQAAEKRLSEDKKFKDTLRNEEVKMRENFDKEMRTLKNKLEKEYEDAKRKAKDENDTKISKMRRDFDKETDKEEDKLRQERDERIRELRASIKEDTQHEEKLLKMGQEDALKKFKEQLDKEKAEKQAEMRKQVDLQLDRLRSEVDELEKERFNSLEEKKRRILTEIQLETNSLLEKEKQQLTKEREAKLSQMKHEQEKLKQKLVEQLESEFEHEKQQQQQQMKKHQQKQMQQLQKDGDLQAAMGSVDSESARLLDRKKDLLAKQKRELESLQDEFDRSKQQMKEENAAEEKKLKKQLDEKLKTLRKQDEAAAAQAPKASSSGQSPVSVKKGTSSSSSQSGTSSNSSKNNSSSSTRSSKSSHSKSPKKPNSDTYSEEESQARKERTHSRSKRVQLSQKELSSDSGQEEIRLLRHEMSSLRQQLNDERRQLDEMRKKQIEDDDDDDLETSGRDHSAGHRRAGVDDDLRIEDLAVSAAVNGGGSGAAIHRHHSKSNDQLFVKRSKSLHQMIPSDSESDTRHVAATRSRKSHSVLERAKRFLRQQRLSKSHGLLPQQAASMDDDDEEEEGRRLVHSLLSRKSHEASQIRRWLLDVSDDSESGTLRTDEGSKSRHRRRHRSSSVSDSEPSSGVSSSDQSEQLAGADWLSPHRLKSKRSYSSHDRRHLRQMADSLAKLNEELPSFLGQSKRPKTASVSNDEAKWLSEPRPRPATAEDVLRRRWYSYFGIPNVSSVTPYSPLGLPWQWTAATGSPRAAPPSAPSTNIERRLDEHRRWLQRFEGDRSSSITPNGDRHLDSPLSESIP